MDMSDALEVAKLAASVGSQLKAIDQFTVDRSSMPANKININNFIANVKNPNARIAPARYLTETPLGFAPPPEEDYVQQAVPYQQVLPEQPQQQLSPPIQQVQMPVASAQIQTVPQPITQTSNKKQNDVSFTRGDIDSIKNSLKNIDKTLSGMLVLLQSKKLTTNE